MSELRLVAYVGRLSHGPRTRHLIRRGRGLDTLMPPAQVVLMELAPDGSAQVYRFTLDGEFGGDTWHETRADAEHQLEYEYGDAIGKWAEVPPEVADAQGYAVKWAQAARPDA